MISFLKKTEKDLQTPETFEKGSWIYVENPSEEEVNTLIESYDLDRDLIMDALDVHEIPRLEIDGGVTYLYIRVPVLSNVGEVATSPVLIVVSATAVITIERESFLKDISKVALSEISTDQKRHFALYLIGTVLASYARFLSSIGKQIRRLRVYPKNVKEGDILNFVTQESVLNDYESSLKPLLDIYKSIKKHFGAYEDEVDDLELATEQLINSCESNLKTIVNLREAYSAIATNNLNRVIRVLTAFTILLTVPTIVASLFGMNVPLPFSDSPHALSIILILTFVISVVLFLFFRWRRWL